MANGLLHSDGALHRRQRRLMMPAFHRARIAGYADVMAECVKATVDSWRDGQQLALDRELGALTLAIVTRTLFTGEAAPRAAPVFARLVSPWLAGINERLLSPLPWLARLPTRTNRRFNAMQAELHRAVDEMIAAYRADGRDHGDLLSMLLLERDEQTGEAMTDRQARDEALSFMLAGAETSSNALAWACHLLATHPDIQARLHQEVDRTLAGRPAGLDDLAYTRRVLTETLRLHSPIFMNSRGTVADVNLGGHAIPAGSNVWFSPYALHRDPTVYAEPDRFDPDRWLPERAETIPRNAFIPFGTGRYGCLGERFAWTEMLIALSYLTSRWTIQPVPGHTVRPAPTTLLSPNALPVTVHRRT
jgi:pentalenene oxygenase